MIPFLTTPIFHLTPYIFLWSILNGIIVFYLILFSKRSTSKSVKTIAAFTTAIASIFWNWSIEFNRSTIYLNVDHPIFRISWADAFNGVGVFALTTVVLSFWTHEKMEAAIVSKIAGLAALVTTLTDTFLF